MTIKVPTLVYNVIRNMIQSNSLMREELNNVDTVTSYLIMVKELETAKWIDDNQEIYRLGILAGFEIDNSQEAQLRDIHTTTQRPKDNPYQENIK